MGSPAGASVAALTLADCTTAKGTAGAACVALAVQVLCRKDVREWDTAHILYRTGVSIMQATMKGLTLAQLHTIVSNLNHPVYGEALPLRAGKVHFNPGRVPEVDFRDEVRRSVADPDDILICNFAWGIAHGSSRTDGGGAKGSGGGHIAIIADYLPETDEVIMRDPVHGWAMTFWRCPLARLHAAMQTPDKTAGNYRGMVRIAKDYRPQSPLMAKYQLVPSFEQERALRSAVGDAMLQRMEAARRRLAFNHLARVPHLNALGHAFAALGVPTEPDSFIHTRCASVRSVCGETGAMVSVDEVRGIAERYAEVHRGTVDLSVEVAPAVSADALAQLAKGGVREEGAAGGAVHLIMFSRSAFGIAGDDGATGGGGDAEAATADEGAETGDNATQMFALLACSCGSGGDPVAVVANSRPWKNGRFSCFAVSSLFAALKDARHCGVLRIQRTGGAAPADSAKAGPRELPTDKWAEKAPPPARPTAELLAAALSPGLDDVADSHLSRTTSGLSDCGLLEVNSAESINTAARALSLLLCAEGDPVITIDDVVARSRIPVAQFLTMKMTTALMFEMLSDYILHTGAPLKAEVRMLDDGHGLDTQEAYSKCVAEQAQTPGAVTILHFCGKAAFGKSGIMEDDYGDGTFGILEKCEGDIVHVYNAHLDQTLKTTAPKLFDATRMKEGGSARNFFHNWAARRRGFVRISLAAVPPVGMGRREHLLPAELGAIRDRNPTMFIDLKNGQQPINCCSSTSLAHGLNILGYPDVTVDDIFQLALVPLDKVTGGTGLTIGESAEIAARYIGLKGLPLRPEVCVFDEGSVSVDDFRSACKHVAATHDSTMLFNFQVSIAHGGQGIGGGHFSNFADYLEATDEVVVTDVNPRKYLRLWKGKTQDLFDAMQDHDRPMMGTGRARGVIRVAKDGAERLPLFEKRNEFAWGVWGTGYTSELLGRTGN